MMLKYIFALAISATVVYSGDANPEDYITHEGTGQKHAVDQTSSWTENSTQDLSGDWYMKCHESCEKKCVAPCPTPVLCDPDTQTYCGKSEFESWSEEWGQVWPDCIKDDICIPKHCECT